MKQYVGLDVSDEEASVCVIDEDGVIVVEDKVPSEPEAIAAFLGREAPHAVKVGFETGPLSTWHWHELTDLGVPAVCIDARHAKGALSCRINKTDRNDAVGIAQIIRMGWYREVKVKSYASHYVRSSLRARALLIKTRCDYENQIRGFLKTFGFRVGKTGKAGFVKRVRELIEGHEDLQKLILPMLEVREAIRREIAGMDRVLGEVVKGSETLRRLMTVPGVGPITALSFASAVDDPGRFRKASSVGAYLGLTPRRYQSGETDRPGRISKAGDGMVRKYLFEAAVVLVTRGGAWSPLKAWGVRLAKRVGMKRAIVAVARKLAVVLHCIWVDGTEFVWTRQEAQA